MRAWAPKRGGLGGNGETHRMARRSGTMWPEVVPGFEGWQAVTASSISAQHSRGRCDACPGSVGLDCQTVTGYLENRSIAKLPITVFLVQRLEAPVFPWPISADGGVTLVNVFQEFTDGSPA